VVSARGSTWVSCLVGAWALLAADVARAQEAETASLGWSRLPGAETCPTAIELGEAAERILGRDVLVAAPDAALSIEGRIAPSEGGFRAVLALVRRGGASEGERVYEHVGACAASLEPLAMMIALMIDPDAEPAPATEPATEPEAEPATEPAPVPDWLRLTVDLSASLAAFVMPSAAPAGRLFAALRFLAGAVPLAVGVVGSLVPWSRAELAGGAWADFLALHGGAGLCAVPVLAEGLELATCALGEAGGVFVIGQRAVAPDERERVSFLLELAVTLRLRVRDALTAHAGASLAIPFRTEPWQAAASPFYRPDPVGFFVFVGLGADVGLGG
jgi:hypothetical protein